MTESAYLQRACPSCGSLRHDHEVASGRRAENLPIEELRPFWSGFFKEKVFFSYHRCADCGLLFAPTFFSEAQLDSLYAAMAPNMDVVTSDAIIATQRGYYEVAARAGVDGSYLEIGPDVGHIVEHAASTERFDHFWLFEPNRAVHAPLAQATQSRPCSISTAMTDLSAVPDGSVGLAVMVHVLDHLVEPVPMLAQIRRKLKPGGALVTVTHNERSLLRHAMGNRWPPFCLQHPEVYSPASITGLMRRAGFAAVRVERSRNYFPVDFLVRQAAWAVGLDLSRVRLPTTRIGLRLGNIMTVARP
jgi:SAM-dependent methyltransferase